MKFKLLLLCALLMSACVKHETLENEFHPISEFSGRILVINKSKRFQLELDWKGDERLGMLRLTHGLSGRIIDVAWKDKTMLWHDNEQRNVWQPLSEKDLSEMGIMMAPWMLSRVFTGQMPKTMKTKDNRSWKGSWGGADLTVQWASHQQRVELTDIKSGQRAVVIFND